MSASGSQWNLDETFSAEELQVALELRQKVKPTAQLRRRDSCPHIDPCKNVQMCIEAIAWYLRHRNGIEPC